MNNTANDIKLVDPVVVAMSGGVDSSVAAALINNKNDNVIGITLRLYDEKKVSNSKTCCSGADIMDARKIANNITIPHYVLDYEKTFKENVINPFIKEYEEGKTPIPCISCNDKVKFLDLLKFAKSINAKKLVTGHYIKKIKVDGEWRLYIAEDSVRDQSYFLFSLNKKDLDFIDFPLGDYKKNEIRDIAYNLNFHLYDKKDSQDICFVPDGNYKNFVRNKVKPTKGEIVDVNGKFLSEHEGIHNFTVGQRRGLGISQEKPLYVKRIEPQSNRVVVAFKDEITCKSINVNRVNLFTDLSNKNIFVKVRSTGSLLKASIDILLDNSAVIHLERPESAIAPGQACVFYDIDELGTRLLGGGWITSTN